MRRVSRMAAAVFRFIAGFTVVLVVISLVWTTLFLSTHYTHRLIDRPVYGFLDPADNRTWKKPERLLVPRKDGQFYLNGKPKRIISGEFHYFRVHPAQWDDRLRRMRTAGLNTITTRVPWNFHERRQSTFQFRGIWNLADFIRHVHRLGFLLMIHIGPYIDADWELGGLPSWLLRDRHMILRTSTYPPFLEYVRTYFDHLLPIIDRFSYHKHGPIVAVQVENEFGSYGHEDVEYLQTLVQLIRNHGIHELIITADRGSTIRDGSVPGTLATVTCRGQVEDVEFGLAQLSAFQPDLPRLVTLLDTADGTPRWGQLTHSRSAQSVANFRRSVDVVLSSNASINIYAFAGGTNFGLWNGAVEHTGVDSLSVHIVRQAVRRRRRFHRPKRPRHDTRHQQVAFEAVKQSMQTIVGSDNTSGLVYRPACTSYNYSPPPIISQSGSNQFSIKYHALRRLLLERRLITRLQTVPYNPTTSGLGVIRLDQKLSWDSLLDAIPSSRITLDWPVFMEQLNTQLGSGQDKGWIVYRTRVTAAGFLNVSGTMRDRVQLYLDGRLLHTVYNNRFSPFSFTTQLPQRTANLHHNVSPTSTSTLELVVENMGRSSFGLLDEQRKGFEGSVIVDDKMTDAQWEHFSIDFSTPYLTAIKHSRHWTATPPPLALSQGQPTLYRGRFKVKQPKDTYIDMTKWTKGVVVVNGFVLGRYWNIGPQQSLYVPSPILTHGQNEILVFELERTVNAKVKFVPRASWDHHKHRG